MTVSMLHARVCDPLGPLWTRRVAPILAGAFILGSPFAPIDGNARIAGVLLGIALLFGRRLLQLHHPAREATVAVAPGSIAIQKAGLLDQEIRSSEVVAASTARTKRGVGLALVRRGAIERPVVLDFQNDADLDQVRRALGIGFLGFGAVAWPIQGPRPIIRPATVLAAAWLALALCAAFDWEQLAFPLGLFLVPATAIAVLVACFHHPRDPYVALTAHGLASADPRTMGAAIVPYRDVLAVAADDRGVLVTTPAGPWLIAMPRSLADEREHLAAQIGSAAARARGEGPPPPALPEPLARLAPHGESQRAWLQRIDATAATVAGSDAYRSSDLDPSDLWRALESPDAPTPVRAAAARVLARVAPDEIKSRVEHVLASDRDVYARSCIRVALEEDVELAAEELERIAHGRPASG